MKKQVRAVGLVTALAAGIVLATMGAGDAEAAPRKPKDNGVRCSLPGAAAGEPYSDEDYVFYMPGQKVLATGPNGEVVELQCQPDGTWKRVSAAAPRNSERAPVHTFEQVP